MVLLLLQKRLLITSQVTKRYIITSIALLTLTVMHLHVLAGDIPGKQSLNSRVKSGFIENKGQVIDQNNKPNPSVLYLLNTPGMNVQLRRSGFSYDLFTVTGSQGHKVTESQDSSFESRVTSHESRVTSHESRVTSFHRIDFDLLNPYPACEIITSGRSDDYANYYTTGTPAEGVTNVRSYQTVTYKNIYPEIDLEFMTDTKSGVKYNFVVHPGGKLSSIRMKITDPEIAVNDTGSLQLKTSQGTIEEAIPESHYRLAGFDKAVKVRFYKVSLGVYGFLPDSPIPANATLTIDPVPDRVWGTYYGGTQVDNCMSTAIDISGYVYIAGFTASPENIATTGSHQATYAGGSDGFFAKFTSAGVRVWGTYYGGSSSDQIHCITVSSDQNLIISGYTSSLENVSTSGSHQPAFAGGLYDAFLAKFDNSGIRLWGTYYGGTLEDESYTCTVDPTGNIYLEGATKSTTDIATTGSHQPALGGGRDSFLVKFTADGTRLWGTYYGGDCDENTSNGRSCALDGSSWVYICGTTCSAMNIAVPGSYQPALAGGADGFLVKFDPNGVRQWGTYFGGALDDIINSVKVTSDHGLMFPGMALSTSGIASPGSFQPVFGGGNSDAFLARFDQDGQRLWSTYYGGIGDDDGMGAECSSDGSLYMTGRTSSTNGIATINSFQNSFGGGIADGMIVKFDAMGNQIWGTYYGGPGDEWIYSCSENSLLTHYFCGGTNSLTNISTTGSHQPNFGGGTWDGFLVKFTECTLPVITIAGNISVYQGSTEVYTTQPGMTGYTWTFSPGGNLVSGGTTSDNTITIQWNTLGAQWVKVNYTNTDGCSAADPFQLDVTVLPQPCVNPSNAGTISISQQGCGTYTPAPLTSLTQPTGQTGTLEYKWQQSTTSAVAGFTDIAGSNSPDYSPGLITQTTWYRRVARVDCMADWTGAAITEALEMTVTIPVIPTVSITATQLQVCAGTSVTFTATGLNGGAVPVYQWRVNAINVINAINAVFTYVPLDGDQITCVFTSDLPCTANNPATSNTIMLTVTQPLPVSVTISATSNPVCLGTSVTFTAAPNNEGLTPIYQWKVNGGNVGTGLPTYTYIPASGDLVSCILTSSLTCVTGNPATATPITMTVNSQLPVGVTITVTANPVCEGTPVTFSANPANPGGAPIYQWKLNDIDAGINSQSYTMTPANNDQVKCILTSSMNCVTGNPATSLPILMNVAPTPAVTFINCFDAITTVNAKPIRLKGGLPLNGTYSGPGVNSATAMFTPSVAGIGTKTITYSYTNAALCSASQTQTITVQTVPVFTCGNNLIDIRDNKVYPTVQIGSQCWMQTNLDFGAEISDAAHQTDNCIVEKYISHVSPVTRHAFYQWDELMLYENTPGLQGLCPPGWHVPDESEWTTLFNFYQGNARAGYPLQDPYLNGFKALQNGVYYLNSTWSFTDFATLFWSSTMADQTSAYAHGMNTIDQSVSVYAGLKANGFSVRCLRD
jgi:uncharacterized protein (TIGR02145 family)